MTRNLAMYIAAGYMVDEGENTGITSAQTLAYDHIERALLEGAKEQDRVTPKTGSYERLMNLFGGQAGPM